MRTSTSSCLISLLVLGLMPFLGLAQSTNPAPYCLPNQTYSCANPSTPAWIHDFSFTGTPPPVNPINQVATGCNGNANNYIYYTNLPAVEVTPGNSYNIRATTAPAPALPGCGCHGFAVYIDYNQDGDFDDPGEAVANSGSFCSHGTPANFLCSLLGLPDTWTSTITIPSIGPNVRCGQTRMRVIVISDATFAPCGTNMYETQDYNIIIGTPMPPITITPANPTRCASDPPTTLTATPQSPVTATYTWQPGNLSGSVVDVSPTVTTTYTVTGTNPLGCTSTAEVTVTVNPAPTVTISPAGPLTLCVGQTEVLTASGATSYSWSPATDLSATNVANPTLTANTVGTRTYTVTGTGANGCTNTATVQVTVSSALNVSISPAGPLTLCVGQTEVLTASGATTYSWSPATDLSATNVANPTLTATTLGTRTYTVTGTSGSCTGSAEITVTVVSNVNVSISPTGPLTLCTGETQVLTASGATSYSWSPGTDLSATNVANPTLTAATVGTRTYTVTGTSGSCTGSAEITVTVNPSPTVTINPTGPLSFCTGQTQVLTASGASNYSWSPGTDLSATDVANPTLTATTPGTRTYTVLGESANACTGSATIQVTVNASPTVAINPAGPLTLCVGQTEVLTASGATSYSWSPATDLSAANVANPTLTATTLGTRTYTVTGTAANGCTGSATVQVTVANSLTVTITPAGPLTLCTGETQVLTASGATSYSWSPGTDLSATNVANPTLTAATVGTRTYTVTGTSGSCTASAQIEVTVNPRPTVTINPTGPLTFCTGQTQVLTASGASNYSWSPGTDLSATDVANPTLTATTPGTRTYTVLGESANACTNSATIQVTVNASPTVTINPAGPLTLCVGETQVLAASGATTYSWSPGTDLSATNVANPTLTATTVGTRTYTVTGTSGSCTGSAEIEVTVNPRPTVTINPTGPLTFCSGRTQVLTASGASNYSWSPATDLSATDVPNPTLTATTPGTRTYTVLGEDLNACTNSATIQVTVIASPTVTATADAPTICRDGTSRFQATGATTYSWSPATALSATNIANPVATPTVSGTWTVVGTTGACTGSAEVSVTVNTCEIALGCPSPTYFQDFDNWNPITPTTNTCNSPGDFLPSRWNNNNTIEGWYAEAAAGTYRFNASDGSCNIGSLYSFGENGSGERALGTLLSGTNNSRFGVRFVNNTGSPITDLLIEYVGEQWRRGTAPVGTPDRLNFQYSTNATSLATGTWTNVAALNFQSPNTTAAASTALNGNAAANRQTISGTITGLNIPPGGVFWIRWTEFNVTGEDDGLAVDDFRITANTIAQPTTVTASTPRCAGTDLTLTANPAPPANIEYRWFDVATGGTPLGTGQNYVFSNPTAGTYTFYVGAFNTLTGCASELPRRSITVTIEPQPTVTASATPTTLCVGQSSQFQANGANTYSWSPVTDLNNALIANPLFTASAAGVFDYTVTGTDGNGCTNSAQVSVTVNAQPTLTATATPASICFDGSTSQLEATGAATYAWLPAANLNNASIFNPVFTPAAAGTLTFTVTGIGANGCTNSATVAVAVNALPTVGATATPATICFDGSTTSQLQGTGAVNYFWSPATGLNDVNLPNPVFTPPAPGSYTFTVEGTDGNGCTNTASVTVTVNPVPAVTATADFPTLCAGGTTRLVASGASTYVWAPATNLSSTTVANPVANPTVTTTWTVTGSDAAGCTNSTQITVTVDVCDVVLDCTDFTYFQDFDTWEPITPTANTCANGNNLPTAWSDNNTLRGWYVELQAGQYRFNANDGTCNLGGMYSFGTDGSGERAIGTNRGGSTMRFGVRLVNNSGAPITDLLIDYIGEQWRRGGAPVGNPDQLLFQYSTDATALTNGTWTNVPALHFNSPYTGPLSNVDLDGNNAANRTAISGTITGLNIPDGAAFWIRWTDFNLVGGNDGLAVDDFRLRANTLAQPVALTPSTPLCEGTDVTLTATPNPPANVDYRWFDVATGGTALATGTTYTITAPAAGTYTYYAESFNTVTGCVSQLPRRSVTFTVNPLPSVNATATPAALCIGQTSQLQATGAVTYSWTPATDLNNAAVPNPVFTAPSAGTFAYTVTGTDANGCTNSTTVSVLVNPDPVATATATPATLCFNGSTSQFEATGGVSYAWTPAVNLNNAAVFNPVFTPASDGSFTYAVTVTDANGCTNSTDVTVTVLPLPVITAASTPPALCFDGSSANFEAQGGLTYLWSPAANLNDATVFNPIFTPSAAGNFTYIVTGTDANGCSNTAQVDVTVFPLPTLTATATPATLCVGQVSQLDASGASTYQWIPATGLNDPLIANPLFFSVTDGVFSYTVEGVDANGCRNTATVTLTVNPLPNVTATATPPAICFDGSTSQLQASGALTYEWFPANDLDNPLIANPTFTPPSPGIFGYTVVGTDVNGCQGAVFVEVTVNALPVINATATPQTICNDGVPSQFQATGADAYVWTPAANLNDNLIANPLFTPPGLGNFTFNIEGTDANGCRNTTQLTVTVIDIPTVTASVTPAAICLDGTVQVSATGALAYSWQPAAELTNPLQATSAARPTVEGAVTYTVTGTDINGCTNSAVTTVTVTNCTFRFDCVNDTYVQDFNTWNPTTTAANTCANGDNLNDPWNNANTLQTWYVDLLSGVYRFNASDGTCGLGGMYSFGSNGGGDRALGTNRGGSAFRFGAQFINNTGVPITDLIIDYVGEQWRRGGAPTGVPDRLDFQYSLDATSLNTGTWINYNPLDFVSPYTGPVGNIELNGDQPANRTAVSSVITGLNIPPGTSFWIRWNDFNLNDDDGLAVDDLRIRVNTIPQPAAITTSQPLCDGVDVTLTAFPPPPPGIEYRWYTVATGGTPVGTGPTLTLTAPIADTYDYFVEAYNTLTGCTSRLPRTAITFVVNNTPVIAATATPNQFCFGSGTSQLQGIGAQDYTWTPQANLNDPLIANPIFNPAVPGTTTFTLTGTDANGCTNSTTVTVVVHALPTVGATANPGLINITQTSQLAGSGAQTYVWTPAANLSSPTGSPTFTPGDCGTTTFTVRGTDANGCTNSAQVVVQVNAAPVTVTANPPAVCIGGCTDVAASSAFGGYTYSWVNPAVTVPSFNDCPTTTTIYNVTATYLNCVTNANVVVPVNPLPIVTVTPNTLVDLCTGESQVYTAGGALTYTWSPAVDLSATTGPVVTLTAATVGPRNYTVRGTDGNGCTNTVSFAVTVRQTPTVITNPQTVTACLGDIRQLNASGASTYLWNPGTDLIQTNVASPTLIATTLGTRTYTVTGTAGNGCTNSATTTVTVFPLPNVTIVPTGPLTICQFQSVNLTASGAATYNWFPNIDLSTTTGPTTTFTGNTPGIYGFSVAGTDNNGCTFVSPPVAITVNPAPTVTIAPAGPLNMCQGEDVQLVASGANTYTWAPATDLAVTNQAATTLTANAVGTRTYTVVGTAANGCTNTASIQVQVRPSPVVGISPAGPLTFCPGATRVLTASGALSYSWSPPTDLSAINIPNPTLTAATVSTRTYTVTGTAANGCTGSATINVTVNAVPPVTANSAPTEACAGDPVQLVAGGANTYVWNPGTISGATITVNPSATTTYTVSGTDANGCTNTAVVQVLVNPLPVAPTTPPLTICAGTSTTITPPAQPGFFRWYSSATGATQIGAGPSFETPVLNVPGVYTYYYDYRDLNGCTSALRQPVKVFVEAIPQVIGPIQGPTVVCAFKSSSHFVSNIPGVGYNWFGLPTGASITSGQGTNSVVINWGFAAQGIHQISVRPTYFCGPGPVSTVQIELIDRPARPLSLTGPPTACVGSTTTYVLSTRPGETYEWRVSPPQAITSAGNTLNVTWSAPGNYVIEGRAVNTCGPSPWRAMLVQVAAPVNANGGPDLTTCNTLAILRAANPSPGTGVWSFVSGPVTPNITQSGTNLLVSGMTQLGVYEFEWTVTSGGCPPLSSRVRVTRIGPPATPTIQTPTIALCDQSTANISFTVPTDGVGIWSFISGPAQAAIAQNGSVTGLTAVGVYTFRYTVSNSCGSSFAEVQITRDASPVNVFAGADQFLCEQTATLVVGNVLPPGYTAQWNYINGPAGSNAGVSSFGRFGSIVNMDVQGIYSFEYVVSTPYQVCESRRDVVRIYRADRPTIAQVVGPTQICGTTVVLTGNIPTIGTASWSFVSGPMTPNLNPQSETLTISGFTQPGLYTFRWTIANPPCTPSAFDHTVEVGIESQGGSATTNAPQVCAGDNIGIVQLSGHDGTIEGWEVSGDPNFTTATFFASTSPSYVFNNLTATTYIRARVRQGSCPPAFSSPVTIQVLPANPTLDLGPDRAICGSNATLTLTKSDPSLNVNWRILSQPAGSAASLVPGSSEATLANLQSGTYFIEVTTETPCGNAQDLIRLDVQTAPQGGAVLSSRNLCAGDNSGILTLSGHVGTVLRWESSTDDWATVIPITNTTAQQGYTNLTQTTAYRAVIGGGPCPTVFSEPAKLTVFPQLTANAGPDQQVCGTSFTLVGNAVTGANSFWTQVSGPVTLPVSIAGEVLAATNVTVPGTYTFRYTLSNGVCPNASDDVTVTVGTDAQAGTVQGDAQVCAGSNTGSAVLVGHSGQIIRWESSTDNWVTVVPLNNTTPVLNYFNLMTTTQFRAVVRTASCPQVVTNHITVLVSQPPTVAQATPAINTCASQLILQGNAPLVGTGQWSFVFGPAQPTLVGAGQTALVTGLTAAGSYLFEYRIENPPCEPSIAYTIVTISNTVPTPTNLGLVNLTANTALVSWTPVPNVAGYIVEWSDASTSFTVWSTAPVCSPNNSYQISGLTAGRAYRVRVRANCTNCPVTFPGDKLSAYTPTLPFTTPASREAAFTAAVSDLSVYPNPNDGRFMVRLTAGAGTQAQLQLVDLAGRAVFTQAAQLEAGSNEIHVLTGGLAAGVYLLLVDVEGLRHSMKVVLN